MIGRRFGRLVVLEEVESSVKGKPRYRCLCDCGNIIEASGNSLRMKKVRSCGCLHHDQLIERNTTHGCSKERLYRVWRGMIDRCYDERNESYGHYGGRGIQVCEDWRSSYLVFKEFMISHGYKEDAKRGECTIERVDINGNYSPDNCKVISMQEQAWNKTNSHMEEYNGEKKTIAEWALEYNIPYNLIFKRLQRGWTMHEALNTPKKSAKLHEVDGVTHTLKEWAQILGIPWSTLRKKINKGEWTIEYVVHKFSNN